MLYRVMIYRVMIYRVIIYRVMIYRMMIYRVVTHPPLVEKKNRTRQQSSSALCLPAANSRCSFGQLGRLASFRCSRCCCGVLGGEAGGEDVA
jgi:hypothetical protein